MANRDYFFNACQLKIFIKKKSEFTDTCCPVCKQVIETTTNMYNNLFLCMQLHKLHAHSIFEVFN